VAPGFPSGMSLVKNLGVKYWISAHDEVKDNQGLATAWIKSQQYSIDDAQVALDAALQESAARGEQNKEHPRTVIMALGVGEEFRT